MSAPNWTYVGFIQTYQEMRLWSGCATLARGIEQPTTSME